MGLIRMVVCDSGPIIHLDELGCLDLLSDFTRIIIPELVWQEIIMHRPEIPPRIKDVSLERLSRNPVLDREVETIGRLFTLHQGEKEALLIARGFPNSLFITDDQAARMAARSLGMTVHGTIGILIRSIRRKMRTRDQIIDILQSIPSKSTLFLKSSLLEEIVVQLETGT